MGYLDTAYRIKNKIRRIENEECAAGNCNRSAIRWIVFDLGFSAGFCDICSEDLLAEKIGKVEDTSVLHNKSMNDTFCDRHIRL